VSQSEINLSTVDAGLQRLKSGIPWRVNGVEFWLNRQPGTLEVRALTSWDYKTTGETVSADLQRAQSTFDFLTNSFSGFACLVTDLTPRFSVVRDMGNTMVELGHLSEGGIILS